MLKTRTTTGLLKTLIRPQSSFRFIHSSTIAPMSSHTTNRTKELENEIEFLTKRKKDIRETILQLEMKEDEINNGIKTLEKEGYQIRDTLYLNYEQYNETHEDLVSIEKLIDFPDEEKAKNILNKYKK